MHTKGVILDESYYPFGLIMAGLGSKALAFGEPGNRLKYNGKEEQRKEFGDGSGLEWLDYGARMYDNQIGRWNQIDLKSEKWNNYSPFTYALNNPSNVIDPDGQDGIRVIDEKNRTITITAVYYVQTQDKAYTSGRKVKFLDGYSTNDIKKMQKETNEYLNSLNATISEGDCKGYKVIFDLQFKEGGDIVSMNKKASNEKIDGFPVGNSLEKGNEFTNSGFKTKETDNDDGTAAYTAVGGKTDDSKKITMNNLYDTKMNRIHEVFHTLGLEHPKGGSASGIMKYPPERPTQDDINNIGNGSFLPTTIKRDEK